MRDQKVEKALRWSRERWLFLLLALVYISLFARGLLLGDAEGIPDGRAVPPPIPTLFLPTNAPPEATPLSSQSMRGVRRKLNINETDTWMLTAIPGVGESLAERMTEYRDIHGGFVSLEELRRISGIGDKLYGTLCEYLTVEP